jgi:hypothetical protein
MSKPIMSVTPNKNTLRRCHVCSSSVTEKVAYRTSGSKTRFVCAEVSTTTIDEDGEVEVSCLMRFMRREFCRQYPWWVERDDASIRRFHHSWWELMGSCAICAVPVYISSSDDLVPIFEVSRAQQLYCANHRLFHRPRNFIWQARRTARTSRQLMATLFIRPRMARLQSRDTGFYILTHTLRVVPVPLARKSTTGVIGHADRAKPGAKRPPAPSVLRQPAQSARKKA